jgi:hypothetical protein
MKRTRNEKEKRRDDEGRVSEEEKEEVRILRCMERIRGVKQKRREEKRLREEF